MIYNHNGNQREMPPHDYFSSDACLNRNYRVGNNHVSSYYGYAYGEPSYGYVPAPEVTVSQASYKYDALSDSWGKEVSNNKGKVKVTPLTGGFTLTGIYKTKTPDGDICFVAIQYVTKGKTYTALIPKADFIREKYHPYLKEIYRFPSCSKRQFNELISFLVQTIYSQDFMLYPHQGWQELDDGSIIFASEPPNLYIPRSLISPSVARRKLSMLEHSQQEIIQCWKEIFSKNPLLMLLGYYRIGSLFQYFLRKAGIYIKQYIIVEPSQRMDKDKLVAALATGDTVNYSIPTLGAGEETIIQEQKYVYDGITLYTDDCFLDEEKTVKSGLKSIIRKVRGETPHSNLGNGLVVVISENAAFVATKLASENVIVVNTDGIEIEADVERIKSVTKEMDTLVIATITTHMEEFKKYASSTIPNLHQEQLKYYKGEYIETMTMLLFTELFFREFLEFSMLNDESFKSLLHTVDCKSNRAINVCEAIEHEFYSILSNMVRSKSLIPVLKLRGMSFDNDGNKLIIDGNRIYIPSEVIEAVFTKMTTTNSHKSLMRALSETKVLEATDGYTHPIEVHNSNGIHQRLYLYDVSAEILDADILYKIHNLKSAAFLLSKSEVPKDDFITILNNGEDYVAGKQICYKDEENGHFYVTGQSGWGKTYLLCQLLAKCFKLGHRVVVFDSSDSFTYEALCRNLPKQFVDMYITIHDLDKDGIPVDLFELNRNTSLPSKKKLLLGVLQAGIGELSASQSNALRAVLSKVIAELDINDRITCNSIINKLIGSDKESFTFENIKDYLEPLLNEGETCDYEHSMLEACDRDKRMAILRRLNEGKKDSGTATLDSLLNRLEPLFEDIEECRMSDKSWGEFLRNSSKIIVIRTNSAYTESGNQLIDMLLATLYNYQHDNPQKALDVFIDELQNQNFSATSPIRKVMKEGRKSHMSFFGATQDYYPRNTELGSVMGKAGTQIFLRPTPNSANVVAAELRFNKADIERFDSMMRGDLIAKANLFNKELGRNVPITISGHVDDYPKIPEKNYENEL